MTVTLAALGPADKDKMAHLSVHAAQTRFAGSIAEAFDTCPAGDTLHAILTGDQPVGFFRIDCAYAQAHGFADTGDLGLRNVIIGAAHQGKGLGTAAMLALPPYMRPLYPQARHLWLTVNLQNPAAIASYRKGGFQDTGAIWPHGDAGPQHIMRLRLIA